VPPLVSSVSALSPKHLGSAPSRTPVSPIPAMSADAHGPDVGRAIVYINILETLFSVIIGSENGLQSTSIPWLIVVNAHQ